MLPESTRFPKMSRYVPIKKLCDSIGFCEATIRRLIRKHGMPHHRNSPKGKILVDLEAFERYMQSTVVEVHGDPVVTEILRELATFAKAV